MPMPLRRHALQPLPWSYAGSFCYMAPEVTQGEHYNEKVLFFVNAR